MCFRTETEAVSVEAFGLCRRLGLGALNSSSSAFRALEGLICRRHHTVVKGYSVPVSRLFLKVLTLRLLWLNLAPIETSGSQAKARLVRFCFAVGFATLSHTVTEPLPSGMRGVRLMHRACRRDRRSS